jgi:hypothetical protein
MSIKNKALQTTLPKTSPKKDRQGAGGGRPKVDIQEYFQRILPFLQRGFSINSACNAAGIPQSTIADYIKKDEEFSVKIEVASRTMEIASRNNIALALQGGSVETAKWYLERKRKDEFGLGPANTKSKCEGRIVLYDPATN